MLPHLLPARWFEKLVFVQAPPHLPGTCWLWCGWNTGNGYGKTSVGGRHVVSHRAIYVALVGEIPHGMLLDHRCERRACCNPAHLEPVTPQVNTRRGRARLYCRMEETA